MSFLSTILRIMKFISTLEKDNNNYNDNDKNNNKNDHNYDNVQELNITRLNGLQKENPQETQNILHDTLEIDHTTSTSINLMSKMFGFQNSVLEPPDTFCENEAWAPTTEYVGLFRKGRVNAERSPSSSDLQ